MRIGETEAFGFCPRIGDKRPGPGSAALQRWPEDGPACGSRLLAGRDLYRENCTVCHDIDKDNQQSTKLGPSLHHLFKNEKLPLTGAKPTREYVVVKIKFGGQLMPPFIKKMTDAEVNTLVDYIESK